MSVGVRGAIDSQFSSCCMLAQSEFNCLTDECYTINIGDLIAKAMPCSGMRQRISSY